MAREIVEVVSERSVIGSPLEEIDRSLLSLGQLRGSDEGVRLELLEALARAVLSHCGENPTSGDPVREMLASRACDRMACASLLRLLVLDIGAFDSDTRLQGSTALFDRALETRVYSDIGLKSKSQPFEKRERLRTMTEEHELAAAGLIPSFGDIRSSATFRENFSRWMKSQRTAVLYAPFWPTEFTVQTVSEVLKLAEMVATVSDGEALTAASELSEKCADVRAAAAGFQCEYTNQVVFGFVDRTEALVRDHLQARGLNDPATLRFRLLSKTYPLSHLGSRIRIRFELVNDGPGVAQDVEFSLDCENSVRITNPLRQLETLTVGAKRVEFDGRVASSTKSEELLVRIGWLDPDGTPREYSDVVELPGQKDHVDWAGLEYENPYDLNPSTDDAAFFGRDDTLSGLAKIVIAGGSARIEGERRVGKTSIAKALQRRVTEAGRGDFKFVYTEPGEVGGYDGETIVEALGSRIALLVERSDERLAGIGKNLSFDRGLSALTDLFDEAQLKCPELRFVLVIDEFDSFPGREIYNRNTTVGQGFFQAIRSLSGKPNVGFLLVGGEGMKWIIAAHGQTLNKFKRVAVDYFDDSQFDDYSMLVAEPVVDSLTVSDEAIALVHRQTAGNPYLTKQVMHRVFERHVKHRDIDVQYEDMIEAVDEVIASIDATSFQHFWDDALSGDSDEQAVEVLNRKRVLISIASIMRDGRALNDDSVLQVAKMKFGVDAVRAKEVIRGLSERRILVAKKDGAFEFRVPLFQRWLPNEGVKEVVVSSAELDDAMRQVEAEENLRPTDKEISDLVAKWGPYMGRPLEALAIRNWLSQFGQPADQRSMVELLQGLSYYSDESIKDGLTKLHASANASLVSLGHVYEFSDLQRLRNDFVICPLDGGGSGSSHILKTYRHANRIYSECAVDSDKVPMAVNQQGGKVKAVVIVDDFVGTGRNASKRLSELHREWISESKLPGDIEVFLVAIAGFDVGRRRIEKTLAELEWPVTVLIQDELNDEDKCFSEKSRFFDSGESRARAQALCQEHGRRLDERSPFGYGNLEAAVCFEYRCPNNSLPVIWKKTDYWEPLFARL